MKKAKILANVSNVLVTLFLVILIPLTIVGTYSIAIDSQEIKENTRFRVENERIQDSLRQKEIVNDSLRVELNIEKCINSNTSR